MLISSQNVNFVCNDVPVGVNGFFKANCCGMVDVKLVQDRNRLSVDCVAWELQLILKFGSRAGIRRLPSSLLHTVTTTNITLCKAFLCSTLPQSYNYTQYLIQSRILTKGGHHSPATQRQTTLGSHDTLSVTRAAQTISMPWNVAMVPVDRPSLGRRRQQHPIEHSVCSCSHAT